ncbi:hypothetical protein [Fuerstiella marisgermanici]|uniref:hypothetical protein n=1 Tax=Fuerstiella marisgermanici TaxID=1891926 RepID=UPI0011AB8066|nr:hypothetical protein [Fuerstiella marisgermanici]
MLSARDSLVTGIDNQYGMKPIDQFLYFNVLPKIEVHGLATSEKVAGVKFRRKALTPKGHAFLAYIDRLHAEKKETKTDNRGEEASDV